MIRIGILGDIGSGKSYVANHFGYPVFNADKEVSKLYKKNKAIYFKLKGKLPKYISKFPVDKNEITQAILSNKNNLRKIIDIVHKEIGKKLKYFLKKNKNKKIIILDIPLLLENKLDTKRDILIFVDSEKQETIKRLKKRPNFNNLLMKKFKKIQLSLNYKRKRSHFIIKNNFSKKSVKNQITNILIKV